MPKTRIHWQRICVLGLLGSLLLHSAGWAASRVAFPDVLPELATEPAQREAVEAIAGQPALLREAALRVSTEPQLIVRVESIRTWSSRGFEEILEGRDDGERADLWEMSRYPELIDAVVEGADPLRVEGEIPAEAREVALRSAGHSPDALERMHALRQETDEAFAEVLGELEPDLADALELVAGEPVLLSVLAENLALTVKLGEAYQRDPEEVSLWLSEVAESVAATVDREREQWSEAIQEDDQLRDDVIEAASAWEDGALPRQAAYDDGYDHGYDRGWNDGAHHDDRVRPYPYWYGYPVHASAVFVPAAHSHSLWRPRSHWGHLGFRIGHGRSLVVLSGPSFPFLYWLRARHPDHRLVHSYAHHRRARRLIHKSEHHHGSRFGARRHHDGDRKFRRERSPNRRDSHGRVALHRTQDSRDERRAHKQKRARRDEKRARTRGPERKRHTRAERRTKASREQAREGRRKRSERSRLARSGEGRREATKARPGPDRKRRGEAARRGKNSREHAKARAHKRAAREGKKNRSHSAKSRAKRREDTKAARVERRRVRLAKQGPRAERRDRGKASRPKKTARREAKARRDTERSRPKASPRNAKARKKAKAQASQERKRAKARRSAKASKPKARRHQRAKMKQGANKKPRAERKARSGKAERKRDGKASRKRDGRKRGGRRVARH